MSEGSTTPSTPSARSSAATPRLALLFVVSICYYAAVTIGNNVAQSIFVSHLGVRALPNIFLIKAGIDVVSSLLYLPLTRERSPRKVWGIIMLIYVSTVVVGWWSTHGGVVDSNAAAYLLYAGHEVAWTLAVIHWGILLLDLFPAASAKRYFPMLFGMGRLGALLGGICVSTLAVSIGALHLLWLCAGLAAVSGLLTSLLPPSGRAAKKSSKSALGPKAWSQAWESPLLRVITLSTATMVLLRYGLRIVSLEEIRLAFDRDADQVAAFLGLFSVLGNAIAFVLGIWLVPRLLQRVGISAANLLYATTTVAAFVGTWLFPSLASASAARFVEMPLKHALKTPISVLFYGAESQSMRLAGRSLIFGLAIPAATIVAGLSFRHLAAHYLIMSVSGAALGVWFVGVCHWQNRRYHQRRQLRSTETSS